MAPRPILISRQAWDPLLLFQRQSSVISIDARKTMDACFGGLAPDRAPGESNSRSSTATFRANLTPLAAKG